jgi:curved DNA-binding protein CbpA
MEPGITWYEVLGVLPGAAADKIRRRYEERAALLRGEMIAGAPSNVLVSVRRAQEFLDGAWEVLGDTATRERYDEATGFRHRGGSLTPAGTSTAGTSPRAPGRIRRGEPVTVHVRHPPAAGPGAR